MWIALGISAVVLLIGGGALLGFVLTRSDSEPSVTATQSEPEADAEAETEKPKLEGRSGNGDGSGAGGTRVGSPNPALSTTVVAPTLPPPTAPATAAPTTAAPTTAPAPTRPPAVLARVNRTCGADDTGDCFVSLRPSPSASGPELGRLDEGSTVNLECQQLGQSSRSSELGYSTDVWARSTDGQWMSMAFLDAPGWSLTDVTVPC